MDLGRAPVSRAIAQADVPVHEIGIRSLDCATLTDAVVHGLVVGIDIAGIQPLKRGQIHGGHKDLVLVVIVGAAGGVVETFVQDQLAGGVGDISTALHTRVAGHHQVPGRHALVVHVSAIGEGRGGRGLDDVAVGLLARQSGQERKPVARIGCNRAGEQGRRGAVGAGGGRRLPALLVFPDPVIVVGVVARLLVFKLQVDGHLAAVERLQGQRRGEVEVLAIFEAALALRVFPGAHDPHRGLLGEHSVVVEHDLLAAVVIQTHGDRGRDLGEGGPLGDVVDDAAGIALAEEHRSRALHYFHALDVVEIVADVAEDAIAHQGVDLETTHGEAALRGGFVGGDTHGKTGVTGRRGRVTEQIRQGLGIGVIEELAGDDRNVQGDLLDLHADPGRRRGVGLEVTVILVTLHLEGGERDYFLISSLGGDGLRPKRRDRGTDQGGQTGNQVALGHRCWVAGF